MNKTLNSIGIGLLTAWLVVLSASASFGQQDKEKKVKFGEVSDSEVRMKVYEKDTSATAVVLYDRGESYFIMDTDGSFRLIHERHRRIKILSKKGYQWADHEVLYYGNQGEESVSVIMGNTFVLEGDRVVKYPLKDDAIFTEKVSKKISRKKFTLPHVKEGAVIEYSYRASTIYWQNFKIWRFQDDIPVVWSEYVARLPEYFNFRLTRQRPDMLHIDPVIAGKEFFGDEYCNSSTYRWVARDVAPFPKEGFTTSPEDYIAKVEFQLIGYKFPRGSYVSRSENWNEVSKTLLEDDDFGRELKKNIIKEIPSLSAAVAASRDANEKMLVVYNFVKQNIEWNGKMGIHASEDLRKVLEIKTGSVADINLLLTNLLRGAGIEANPVILSTRTHGKIREWHSSAFYTNYVIVHVKAGDTTVLLDATEENRPIGLLPVACLNGQGWLVGEKNSRWVNIENSTKNSRTLFASLHLNAEGVLTGTVQNKQEGYFAMAARNRIAREGVEKYNRETFKSEISNITIKTFTINNLLEVALPFKSTAEIEVSGSAQGAADLIYLNPLLPQAVIENPFKLKDRQLPVDFPYPWEENYIMSLNIPAGYKVESLPQNLSLMLPGKAGTFVYSSSLVEDKIQFTMKFIMNQTSFSPEEYAFLHEFYLQLTARQGEQIVLKKM